MSMELPRQLGKYELMERLGYGGMAEVWKALDTQLQRYVAIKILHPNLQVDQNFVTRFQREAQVIAALRHPNIVPVHDFQIVPSKDGKNPIAYMVMGYVEGQTLADYIASTSAKGQFPPPTQLVSMFTSISLAVDYAHQKGMIHRDIKPANILLDKNNTSHNLAGEPILTDFGLARLLGTSSGLATATQPGTPLYTSPEQAQGYAGNERSDLYSLGVILYEMATGVPPFRGDTPVEILSQHIYATPISPVLFNPGIPPALTLVIMTALAKDPNARFIRASSMTAALAEALHVQPSRAISQPMYPPDAPDMATQLGASALISRGLSPLPTDFTPSAPPASFTPMHGKPLAVASSQTPQFPPSSLHAMTPTQPQTQPGAISHTTSATTPFIQTPTEQPATQRTPTPPTAPPLPPTKRRWNRIYTVLVALILLVLLGSGLGAYFTFLHPNNAPVALSGGQAFFLSSGQFDFGTAQGIGDELQINLQHIPDPQAGKSYYAWLLGDKHPQVEKDPLEPTPQFTLPLLLGKLTVTQGNATLFYQGTPQHDNLLSVTSRLLITEENTNGTPRGLAAPSSTWRYYAEIPQTPYGSKHLSALDHIRHLFYKETKVEVLGLAGGLDVWLFRNTEKVMEWASSARDDYRPQITDPTLMHNLFLSILDYLDGSPNVHIDTPVGSPIVADPTISKVALLSVVPAQQQLTDVLNNPPGYVTHIQLHLNGVVQAPDATPQMRLLATKIIESVNNAQKWLQQVRAYARELAAMNAAQLSQPSTLTILDNMLSNATFAYIGQLNPANNEIIPGVLQAHYDIQQLATFTITSQVPHTL